MGFGTLPCDFQRKLHSGPSVCNVECILYALKTAWLVLARAGSVVFFFFKAKPYPAESAQQQTLFYIDAFYARK